MATETGTRLTSETAILSRLIRPDDDSLTADAAEALLRIRFEQGDLDRIHDLVTRNQEDRLTPAEQVELENYRRVSFLLDLLHSKARRSLKNARQSADGMGASLTHQVRDRRPGGVNTAACHKPPPRFLRGRSHHRPQAWRTDHRR